MQIANVPYRKINWEVVPITKYSGETGKAYWRTIELENIPIRRNERWNPYLM